jgi:small subunit ribosomal protein S1
MIDDLLDENDEKEEKSFASLLDSYSPINGKELQVGDKVQGKIISIGKDTVFVDTNTKIDGVADKQELVDENGQLQYEEGDLIELFVVSLTEDEIKLSKAISGIGGLHILREAYEKTVPVEGKIIETCKGGFRVDVLHRRAFCPLSQVDLEYVENPDDYVGSTHRFLINQFEENGQNIVLSRRVLLSQELEKSRKKFYETLSVGMVTEGKITRLMPYGAFVELSPGVEGMAHISELSWSKIKTPDEIIRCGDVVTVKVIGIEPYENSDQLKIALSVKQLSEDPWISAGERFHEGEKLKGNVTRCAPFGAFVEIAPGIEGLVHLSEMSYTKRVTKPQEVVSEGETVSVLIKEIDLEKRRISLSIRDAEGDPWLEVPEKYNVGQSIKGIIEKKQKFGYFINLSPGITGLLPQSNFRQSSKPAAIEKLKEGDPMPVIIEAINLQERRITLAPAAAGDEQNWQKYTKDNQPQLGSLGEKLQQALASKKDKNSHKW